MTTINQALYEHAKAKWNSTVGQADFFANICQSDFHEVGGTILHNTTSKPLDSAEVTAIYEKSKPHLFPAKFEVDLATRAFLGRGNVSARGALVKQVGIDEANKIAQRFGLHSVADTRSGVMPADMAPDKKPNGKGNPWSAEHWSPARQIETVKALGVVKAGAIAAAANSFIGANKPNSRRLIPAA